MGYVIRDFGGIIYHEHVAFAKYLNHTGVATPAEIINAVQEGS